MRRIRPDLDIQVALFIAENNIALTALDSTSYSRLLDAYQAKGARFSRKHITDVSLPKCEKKMREYFVNHLRNSSVCLVVDEMTKYGVSYYNFTLCGTISVNHRDKYVVVFWDSKTLDDSTSSSIGKATAETADELLKEGIRVTSFASDNCNAMKKAEDYCICSDGRQLKRVACDSHALNNIFKEMMKLDPIRGIWDTVFSYLVAY